MENERRNNWIRHSQKSIWFCNILIKYIYQFSERFVRYVPIMLTLFKTLHSIWYCGSDRMCVYDDGQLIHILIWNNIIVFLLSQIWQSRMCPKFLINMAFIWWQLAYCKRSSLFISCHSRSQYRANYFFSSCIYFLMFLVIQCYLCLNITVNKYFIIQM